MAEHCRANLRLGSVRILCGWALQGYLVGGHCRDTWWLGNAGVLCDAALQGYPAVGHCRDTQQLGTAGILGGWDTLRLGKSSKHCRDTHWLGIAGILGGWALQGYLVVGHYRDTWWLVTKVSFQSGEDDIYFQI